MPERERSRLHRILLRIGVVLAAAVFLFEEFGWRQIQAMMRALARLPAVARLEAAIARFGPYPALALFVVPIVLLEPLKLLAVWLIATGHLVLGIVVIAFAKVLSTALIARLFHLCQPALLSLRWFRGAYEWTVRTRDRLYAQVQAMPAWQATHEAVERARLAIRGWWNRVGPV